MLFMGCSNILTKIGHLTITFFMLLSYSRLKLLQPVKYRMERKVKCLERNRITISTGQNETITLPENRDEHFNVGASVIILKNSKLKARKIHIGNQVTIGKNVEIECDELHLDDEVTIGNGIVIKGKKITIGKQCTVQENNRIIVADSFELGDNSAFGKRCVAICRQIKIGRFYHGGNEIDFGGGGRLGPNSIFTMGDYGFLGDRCIVNTSEKITIGDDVGIGAEVMLWTHGSYLSVLDGFPADFAPLHMGSHVWVPARSVILPGVTIGSNVVISIGSLVNRDIPSGVLAGGIPAKVIKENYYPKSLSIEKKFTLVQQILKDYIPLLEFKELLSGVISDTDSLFNLYVQDTHQILSGRNGEDLLSDINPQRKALMIFFNPPSKIPDNSVFYNLSSMEITGETDPIAEDLRDYLRRKGVKFFTGQKFMSIIPPSFRRFL
jgi:acetyltransferase-like isoleucine patch superfamily enzyme